MSGRAINYDEASNLSKDKDYSSTKHKKFAE